uniref:RPAP1_N domain-containing protein n=1 Tax=Steinernema glaseri TaxID=37863 RepID=A0A1I7ZYQ4_9BILA
MQIGRGAFARRFTPLPPGSRQVVNISKKPVTPPKTDVALPQASSSTDEVQYDNLDERKELQASPAANTVNRDARTEEQASLEAGLAQYTELDARIEAHIKDFEEMHLSSDSCNLKTKKKQGQANETRVNSENRAKGQMRFKQEAGRHKCDGGSCPLDNIFLEIISNDALIDYMIDSDRHELVEELLDIGAQLQTARKD